ncbi:MAG: acyltransferase [Beijerinckiaceae bacterium]|nr:acyltransferase [Beijerinckiaceae bacterium]
MRSIQYLRGLAALGVLAYHAAERAGVGFGVGAAGVDVFFVISGFIMWIVTCHSSPSPSRFLLRRAERVVPLYWGLTVAVAAVAVFVPAAFPAIRPDSDRLFMSLFFIPHWDTNGFIAPLIIPGWTLNYEMFFYALFAIGLMFRTQARPWFVSVALISLVAARPLGDTANPLWATYTNPLLLEFGAGVWLGKLWSEKRLPNSTVACGMIVAAFAGFIAVSFADVTLPPLHAPMPLQVLWWGVPAFLLVAGAVSLERFGPVPNLRLMHGLGNASYSIYLIHGLAIAGSFRALKMVGLDQPWIALPVSIAAGVAAGFVLYWLVEKPITRFLKAKTFRT